MMEAGRSQFRDLLVLDHQGTDHLEALPEARTRHPVDAAPLTDQPDLRKRP